MRVIVGGTNDTALEVQSHSALGKLTIPQDAILGLVLAPPGESDAFDHLWEQVRGEKRTTDVVWMANGDRQTGGFLGLDDRAVNFQVEGKAVEIDRTGVIAVGFDPAVTNYPRPKGDFLDVTLADGSRLGVVDVKLDKGQVTAMTRFGQSIRFPISDLVRLDPPRPRWSTSPSDRSTRRVTSLISARPGRRSGIERSTITDFNCGAACTTVAWELRAEPCSLTA